MGDALTGELAGIFIAENSGRGVRAQVRAEAMPGEGLRGDRYAVGRGHWTGRGDCEVTIMSEATLEQLAREGFDLRDGSHRRNLVVRGLADDVLSGSAVAIGAVRLKVDERRPPCRYLERLTGMPGLRDAMAGGRAGFSARVTEGGTMRIGDRVRVLAR